MSVRYGVTGLHVPPESELFGKAHGETSPSERDITVLSTHPGRSVLPHPKVKELVRGDDRLLCFGKMDEMCHFVAKRPKRRRRRLQAPDGS